MKAVSALLASVTLAAVTGRERSPRRRKIRSKSARSIPIRAYRPSPSLIARAGSWRLREINAAGGVDGKKLEVISKDDGGKPADAVTAANELVSKDGVVMLCGTFFSNIGLAVSDFAKQKKIIVPCRRAFDRRNHPGPRAIAIRSACVPRTMSRRRCWRKRRPSCRPRNGRRLRPITNMDNRPSRCSRSFCRETKRHRMGRRAMAAARQDRRWRGGRGNRQNRTGRDPQCHVRARPRQTRARRQHARSVQEPLGGELPHRRAGISRSAQGRDAAKAGSSPAIPGTRCTFPNTPPF